jgi:prepilin-type processing-associated H-X9-DG protein
MMYAVCSSDRRVDISCHRFDKRRGTTLIEVLVVFGVTALLMGLLLPAVQSSREAARGHDCRHRMRQLGIATHNFHDTHGRLPVTFHTRVGRPAFPRMLSAWAQLLPFLDQAALYQQIDQDPSEIGLAMYGSPPSLTRPLNQKLLKTSLSVVLCPSDTAQPGSGNFRICINSGPHNSANHGQGAWGISGVDHEVRLAQITDGLSHTALISERVVGDFNPKQFTAARDVYFFEWASPGGYGDDEYAQACRSRFRTPLLSEMSYSGASWLVNGFAFTHYNHTLPPNSVTPDCSAHDPSVNTGAISARSWHPQGVHVVFADGHVRRIAETIDLAVWRMIATRQGADLPQLIDR